MRIREKIFLLVVLLALLGVALFLDDITSDRYTVENEEPAGSEEEPEAQPASQTERLQNARIAVPDTETVVLLTDGEGTFADGPANGYVTVTDLIVPTPEENLLALVIVEGGGSGSFYYLVLYKEVSVGAFEQLSFQFLGDRIGVADVRVIEMAGAGYGVEVDAIVRAEGEPFVVEPTILETRLFRVENDMLIPIVAAGE